MSKYTTLGYRLYHWVASLPPKIKWHRQPVVSDEEKDQIAAILASGYYIILTANKYTLSSIIVSFLSLIKTGKWARYTHVLMNCDNIEDPMRRDEFKFVEADVKGVIYTTFDQVFNSSNVCLLSPSNMSNESWTAVIDALVTYIGHPYDDLFDLADSSRMSCVEVVLNALKKANYVEEFKHLDSMIKDVGNLVPQMYRDCDDFVVVIEN